MGKGSELAETARIRRYYHRARWRNSPGRRLMVKERRSAYQQLAADIGQRLHAIRVCDVGCGAGSDLAWWHDLGVPAAGLFGTELNADRAEAARLSVPGATVASVDAFEIPFASGSMDVVTSSLVLSSILDAASRVELMQEMRRAVRPGGFIAIYDFRIAKPWNRSVRRVQGSALTRHLGPPTSTLAMGPFLPLLDIALLLPQRIGEPLVRWLPRTHAMWVWKR